MDNINHPNPESVVVACYFLRSYKDVVKDLGFLKKLPAIDRVHSEMGRASFVNLVESPLGYGSFWYSNRDGFFFELKPKSVPKLRKAVVSLREPLALMVGLQNRLRRKQPLVVTVYCPSSGYNELVSVAREELLNVNKEMVAPFAPLWSVTHAT